LSHVLEYAEQIQQIDTTGVPPTSQVLSRMPADRPDEPRAGSRTQKPWPTPPIRRRKPASSASPGCCEHDSLSNRPGNPGCRERPERVGGPGLRARAGHDRGGQSEAERVSDGGSRPRARTRASDRSRRAHRSARGRAGRAQGQHPDPRRHHDSLVAHASSDSFHPTMRRS
jgi:hypothetical protein